MKKTIYIIEHLEPEVFPWCLIEYENISKIVGKENLWFTNIKDKKKELEKLGRVFSDSIKDLKEKEFDLKKACVLDPEAKETLNSKDKEIFEYFIFGGILGDYPPKKRTKKELTKFLPKVKTRNIGKEQLATDNAIYVSKEILDGKKLNEIPFKDEIEIEINNIESVILPYRYVLLNGKPLVSEKLVEYLKNKENF
jgi:ribosome biogenesis SPOUT family RNA methylase Rps3